MSEASRFHSTATVVRAKRRRASSISALARGMVLMSLAVIAVVSTTAVGSVRRQANELDRLIQIVEPAIHGNIELFRDMTEAQNTMLRYQLSRRLGDLATHRDARLRVLVALTPLRNQVVALTKHKKLSLGVLLAELETQQRETIKLWLANAQKSERIVLNLENPNFTQSVRLFEDFRAANNQLSEQLELEGFRAHSRAQEEAVRERRIVIAAFFVAAILLLIFGLRLARSITRPVVALTNTIKRQREGDLTVRAHENRGPIEIRELAHDFNLLVEHEAELEQIRSRARRMQELTLKIDHAMRSAANTQQALEILCAELGTGFDVDRVMTNTANADGVPTLVAQWHRPGLLPLGELSDELRPHISAVSAELWKSSDRLVSNERLAPETQSERAKAFYRYSDARASIVVPVGVGELVVGSIYVLTTTGPRDWTEAEVNAVDRVAAFLAQFIVEQTFLDQLNEHVERLEQLNRQKDTFVATVSHELRTPLTSIIGYLEVLKDGYGGDVTEEQEQMLDVIDRNAIRLLGLIQDLLALNKRESELEKIEMVIVSMPKLITTVCQELSLLAESSAIKIECDADPPRAFVRGDRGKLQSAVVNIVSNAIKFSPRGGVVTIGCTLDESNRQVKFKCQDHGIGIPAVDQGELFKRFYRASNAVTEFIPGTGLGLAIVKQIVDDHGGEIHLTSVEGEGTTVVIDLPLAPQGSF